MEAYFRNLGIFIHKFAEVETWLLMAVAKQADIKPPLSQAIFVGVRVATAKDMINRMREAQGIPENAILKRAFAQLTEITNVRNDIVHYGARFRGEWEPHVSNALAAMPGKERSTIATPELLWQMINDLQTILTAITHVLFDFVSDAEPAERPWRYKPALQAHIGQLNQRKNPKPKRPPPPSKA